MNPSDPLLLKLWNAAVDVRRNAYCPYSEYAVGAALRSADSDRIFTGCNVENASYGGTLCAERSAVVSAVSALGRLTITDLVLVTREPAPPCGLCLQVLSEFSTPDTRIVLSSPDAMHKEYRFADLMPIRFDSSQLSSS